MKKIIAFSLVAVICVCLNGCREEDNTSSFVSKSSIVQNAEVKVEESSNFVSTASITDNTESAAEEQKTETSANNAILDPQGGEIGRPLGEIVNITEIKPKTGVHNGIDVSKWQGKIDWQKVKNSGIDFAVIRIGFRGENGNIYKDDYADYNIQQAHKAGILVGVYFFSTAINTTEAENEAGWVKENIKNYPISLPVVYDCEGFDNADSRMNSLTAAQRTDNALSFINTVKAYGYESMFYASKNDLQSSFETERIEKNAKIWIAYFDGGIYPNVQTPDYNGEYSMWQYTNKGVVSGVSGDVDLVVSYEEFSEKASKEQGKVEEAVAPKPKDSNYTDANDKVTAKDIVNLRESASTTSKIVGELKAGEYLERTAIGNNGWSKLNYNGKTVYAVSSYLTNEENYSKPSESSKTEAVDDGFVNTNDKVTPKDSVNLRKEPTTKSEIVLEVSNGTVLERVAKNDSKGWSKISYNGQIVYAVSQYLTTDLNYKPVVDSQTSSQDDEMFFFSTDEQVTAKSETNLRSKPAGGDASQVVYLLKNGEYVQRTGYSNEGWSRVILNGQTLYAVTSLLEVKP